MKKTDPERIVKRAKELAGIHLGATKDRRSQKVVGFLMAKKLLFSNYAKPMSQVKLWAEEVIWTAENVEPRVWEVLPAALVAYPRSFVDHGNFPSEILELAKAIKLARPCSTKYKWIDYGIAARWAEIKPFDRRSKSSSERKRLKSFRLSPECIKKLSALAKAQQASETQVLEHLIDAAD